MRDFHTFKEISKRSSEIFKQEFNEKLFRIQLTYFNDVNYDEKIEFLPGFEVAEEKIKEELIKFNLSLN